MGKKTFIYPKYCQRIGCKKCRMPLAVCRENYCQRGLKCSPDWVRFTSTHCEVELITGGIIICPNYKTCYH